MNTGKESQAEGKSMRMINPVFEGQPRADELTVMAPALHGRQDAYLRTRLALLCDTIQRGTRRRTTRGRMAACAQLGSHRRQAEQLFAYAYSPDARDKVDSLIRRIEEARGQVNREQGEWKIAQEKRRSKRRKRRIGVQWRRFSTGFVAQSGRRKRCRSPRAIGTVGRKLGCSSAKWDTRRTNRRYQRCPGSQRAR